MALLLSETVGDDVMDGEVPNERDGVCVGVGVADPGLDEPAAQ